MKVRLAMLSAIAVLASVAAFWVAPVAFGADNFGVTICHRTGSDKNPYNAITPSNVGVLSAHIGDASNPPHPPQGGRPDFLLPFPGGTNDDCAKGDPDPK